MNETPDCTPELVMIVNYTVVFAAALASYAFGAVYYTYLANRWLAAQDTTKDQLGAKIPIWWLPFLVTFVANVVMAYLLAGVIVHMARSGIALSARSGVISALFLWVGFVMTTMVSNHTFQGVRRMLTVIDGGHWLGVLAIQGAIIGAWGIK
jgi:hypothetical protein